MSVQEEKLTAIADAIREKEGTTAPIPAAEFPERIRGIETGIDTSDATATAADIVKNKTAYVDGKKLTGIVAAKEAGSLTPIGGESASKKQDEFGTYISITGAFDNNNGILFRKDAKFYASLPSVNFGDASVYDVAEGKTFTSKDGVKLNALGRNYRTLQNRSGLNKSKTFTINTNTDQIYGGVAAGHIYLSNWGSVSYERVIVASFVGSNVWILVNELDGNVATVGGEITISGTSVTIKIVDSQYTDAFFGSSYYCDFLLNPLPLP